MHGEIAATTDGKILGVRVDVLADHGAFNGTAQPTKYPAGFFHIFTGSYDYRGRALQGDRASTPTRRPAASRTPARSASPRPSYLIERMVDVLAAELSMDPAELRMKNLLRPEQFPYTTPTGWEYDSGDYPRALQLAMDMAGYDELRAEQAAQARQRGEYMGIGISFFTEGVGAGPRKHMDILGLGHGRRLPSCASTRPARRVLRLSRADARAGPRDDVRPDRRGGARHPARGHRGRPRRHRQHAVRPRHLRLALDAGVRARRPRSWPARSATGRRSSPRRCSRCSPDDLEWEQGPLVRQGRPGAGQDDPGDRAWPRTAASSCPRASRATSTRTAVYNPPNLTYPFGAYICVVDVDPGTGQVKVRRFIAVDDCGLRINPMIVEGQVHGGLADGVGMALMQVDRVRRGRQLPRRVVHGLPAADVDGVPDLGARRDGHAVAAPPDRRQGRRRVGDGRLAGRRGQRRDRRARSRSASGTPTCR